MLSLVGSGVSFALRLAAVAALVLCGPHPAHAQSPESPPAWGATLSTAEEPVEDAGSEDAAQEAESEPGPRMQQVPEALADARATADGAATGGDGLLEEPETPLDGDLTGEGQVETGDDAAVDAEAVSLPARPRVPVEDDDPYEVEPALPPTAYPEEEEDPYAPAGIRLGAFRLLPEIEAGSALTSNAQGTAGGSADALLDLRPGFRLLSDWSRHSLEAEARGDLTFHDRFAAEDDRAVTTALRGRLDVSEETSLAGAVGFDLRQESRSAIDFPAGAAERPDVTTTTGLAQLDHRINRLFLRVAASLRRDNESAGAEADPSANDDFTEGEGLGRAGYEVSPGLSLFIEGVAGRRTFDQVADSDGRLRDASFHELRLGVFLEMGPKLAGELAIGHARLDPDDGALAGADGVVLDGAVRWQPTALTTFSLLARSTLEPTILAGAAAAFGQSGAIGVRHELRRYLALTAALEAAFVDYQGAAIEERTLTARLGAEYVLSREWAVLADYEHVDFQSSDAGRDYTADTVSVAVRLRR